nr:protein of unknown function DUF4283 protein [Ipomoea batatas]
MSDPQLSKEVGSSGPNPLPKNPSDKTQNITKGKGKVSVKVSKAPWADLFRKSEETVDPSFNLSFCPPVNGTAILEECEIWVPPNPWKFGLLGGFAGRFPGMDGVEALVKSWKVRCRVNHQANGFVLFRFQSEEDRCSVISVGPYFLYGKRFFFDSLPENFRIENSELCMKPTWVRLTELPNICWKSAAFSKIASCLGNPICMDKVTKIGKKRDYARILVEIDSSIPPLEQVPVLLPNGDTFNQAVFYEEYPCFCLHCKSVRHYKEQCPKLEPLPGSGDRRAPRQIDNCKRVGLEWKWKKIVLADCNPDVAFGNSEETEYVLGKGSLDSPGLTTSPSSVENLVEAGLEEDREPLSVEGSDVPCKETDQTSDEPGMVELQEKLADKIPRSIDTMDMSVVTHVISPPLISPDFPLAHSDSALLDPTSSIGLEMVPYKPSVIVTGNFQAVENKDPSWDDFADMLPVFSSAFPTLGPFAFDKEIMALHIKARKASKEFLEFQMEANKVRKKFAELEKPSNVEILNQTVESNSPKPSDYKAALLSPPKGVQNQPKQGVKAKVSSKALPIPLRAKSLFRSSGRRRPTPSPK